MRGLLRISWTFSNPQSHPQKPASYMGALLYCVVKPNHATLIRARSVVQVHPGPPFKSRSNPETWVTECTGYMGNTFGPNGFSRGSNTRVSRSKYPRS